MKSFYRRFPCRFLSILLIFTLLCPILTKAVPIAYAENTGYLRSDCDIISLYVPGQYGDAVIDYENHTVVFYMHTGYANPDISALIPLITVSEGASIYPESNENTTQDFSSPVTYTVTAEAGNSQDWVVSCVMTGEYIYYVEHYQQDVDGWGYTLIETEAKMGEMGTTVYASPKSYTGFHEDESHAARIASGTVDTDGLVLKLYYDRNKYSVTFEENGGPTVDDATDILYGSMISPPMSVTREDYIFWGWYTDAYLTQEFDVTQPITTNLTLYAKWVRDKYNVTFLEPDGTILKQAKYSSGTVFGRPDDPVKAGYTLIGWYLDAALTSSYSFDQPITSDMSLYAMYKRNGNDILSFEVSGQDGSSVIDVDNRTVTFYVPPYTEVNALTPNIGLSEGASSLPESGQAMDFSSPVTYRVTAEAGNSGEWTVYCVKRGSVSYRVEHYRQSVDGLGYTLFETESLTEELGATVTAIRRTYTGFYENESHAERIESGVVTEDELVLKLFYDRNRYNVHYEENGGTEVDDANGILYDSTISPPGNLTRENHIFRGWYTDASFTQEFDETQPIRSDLNLYAKWEVDKYTVSYREPDGTILMQVRYSNQAVFSRPEDPLKDGYTLMGWYLELALTSIYNFDQPLTSDISLYAMYKRNGKDILSFEVAGQEGSTLIDRDNHTVVFYMQQDRPVTALAPIITVSLGAEVNPPSGSVVDFSSPVTYTVVAEDNEARLWTVSCMPYTPPEPSIPPEPSTSPQPSASPVQPKEEEKTDIKSASELSVSTGRASSVEAKSAVLNGSIAGGGGEIIKVGFRYRAKDSLSWSYTGTQSLSQRDRTSFSVKIDGLKPDTEYVFEARASNSFGLAQGGLSSFTTKKSGLAEVKTLDAVAASIGEMKIYGLVSDDGGETLTDAGFMWGKDSKNLKKLSVGRNSKNLTTILKKLEIGMTFYYQAYASTKAGTVTGDLLSFVVPGVLVTTLEAVEIKKDSAILQGQIKGNDEILQCGFKIRPAIEGNLITEPDEDGYFKVRVDKLKENELYTFAAYVKTDKGEFVGEYLELMPENDLPKVETLTVDDYTQIAADLPALIHDDKGFDIIEAGFLFGTDSEPEFILQLNPDYIKKGSSEDAPDSFTYWLYGLDADTTYYYKAFARSESGIGYGKLLSFTTLKPVVPQPETKNVGYDTSTGQWVFTGAIEYNGGVPLFEYGFMISDKNGRWNDLPVGLDMQGDYVLKGSNLTKGMEPGTYYVKAYAINSAGRGEGKAVALVVPKLPTVSTDFDPQTIDRNKVTLKGTITDTGGRDTFCHTALFRYRPEGDEEWTDVVVDTGDLAAGSFELELTGLIPGKRYEYMAEAANSYGYASGKVVAFTMNYGNTLDKAIEYLRADKNSLSEMINTLKKGYSISLDELIGALLKYEYALSDITGAVKESEYKAKHRTLVAIYKAHGFSAEDTVAALMQHYDKEMTERELREALSECDFSLAEIMQAMISAYDYDIKKCYTNLFISPISKNQIYEALADVFGLTDLARFHISEGKGKSHSDSQLMKELIAYMRDAEGLDSVAIADILMEAYPKVDSRLLINSFYDRDYRLADILPMVINLYGSDPYILAGILCESSYFTGNTNEINDFLIKELACSPYQMVQIITAYYRRWKDLKTACAEILKDYYKLSAIEAAQVMYAAGWTENSGNGYANLDELINTMKLHFGQTSEYDLIGILKAVGLAPLAIANRIGGKAGWLKSYLAHGYTAMDAALWIQYYYARYGTNSQIGATVNQCNEAGYGLEDIALALRTLYDLDMETALTYFQKNTGYDSRTISEGLTRVYGEDPVQYVLGTMAGQPIKNICSSLYNTHKIQDPYTATDYLKKAGYDTQSILLGMASIYFGFGSEEQFKNYLEYAKKVFPDRGMKDYIDPVIRCLGNEPSPAHALRQLLAYNYDAKETLAILKDAYGVSLTEAIDLMIDYYGRAQEMRTISVVLLVYGMDLLDYIKYERERGAGALECAMLIKDRFGIIKAEEIGGLLARAGYGKEEILNTILEIGFYGKLTAEAVTIFDNILRRFFGGDSVGLVETMLTKGGQLCPYTEAISDLTKEGFGLKDIIGSLKELYGLDRETVIGELIRIYPGQLKEISEAIQSVYGGNSLLAMIKYRKGQANSSATSVYQYVIQQTGVSDHVLLFRNMIDAGYKVDEVIDAMQAILFDGIFPVLEAIYNDKDMVIRTLLRNGQLKSITDAIRLLDRGGYTLSDIALALSNVYGLTADEIFKELTAVYPTKVKEISEAVEAVYGSSYLVTMINYWKGQPNSSATSVYRSLMRESGISDHILLFKTMVSAGYSEAEVVEAMQAILFDEVFPILKTIYNDMHMVIRILLKNGDLQPIANGIRLLDRGGYVLMDIALALSNVYGLTAEQTTRELAAIYPAKVKEISEAVQAAFGDGYLVTMINYWKGQPNSSATSVYRSLMRESGISDHVLLYKNMISAGYSEDEVVTAMRAILNDGVYPVLEAIYNDKDLASRALLRNGELGISEAIRLMDRGGYKLSDIASALKYIYGLTEAQITQELSAVFTTRVKEIAEAVQLAFGNSYLMTMIYFWKSQPKSTAVSIYRSLMRESGIDDHVVLYTNMLAAGFTEYEVIDAMYSVLYDGLLPILKGIYSSTEDDWLVTIAKYWREKYNTTATELYRKLQRESGITDDLILCKVLLAAGLTDEELLSALSQMYYEKMTGIVKKVYNLKDFDAFVKFMAPYYKDKAIFATLRYLGAEIFKEYPEATAYDVTRAFLEFGFPVSGGADDISYWLLDYVPEGVKDKKLAVNLGKADKGLGIPVHRAVDIIHRMGFDVVEAVPLLIEAKYTWREFYEQLVYIYKISSPELVGMLAGKFKVIDIAEGLYGRYGTAHVFSDLVKGGYPFEEALRAIIWLGGTATSDLMRVLSNGDYKSSTKDAALMIFNVSVIVAFEKQELADKTNTTVDLSDLPKLEDIARGLVMYGPKDGFYLFSYYEMLEAMEAVMDIANKLSDDTKNLSARTSALQLLKRAGATAEQAACMLAAHKVGISTWKIIKSIIGIDNGVIDAVMELVAGGYSYSDSVLAVFNNKDYKAILAVAVLSQIASFAVNTLSLSNNSRYFITIGKEVAKVGFMVGEGKLTLENVLELHPGYRFHKYQRKAIDMVVDYLN